MDNSLVQELFISKLPASCKDSYIQMKHDLAHTAKMWSILLKELIKIEKVSKTSSLGMNEVLTQMEGVKPGKEEGKRHLKNTNIVCFKWTGSKLSRSCLYLNTLSRREKNVKSCVYNLLLKFQS